MAKKDKQEVVEVEAVVLDDSIAETLVEDIAFGFEEEVKEEAPPPQPEPEVEPELKSDRWIIVKRDDGVYNVYTLAGQLELVGASRETIVKYYP